MRPPVYHYTCDHGLAAMGPANVVSRALDRIDRRILARLAPEQQAQAVVVGAAGWFTTVPDLSEETAATAGLELTGNLVTCKRWEHRYRVVGRNSSLVPWTAVREQWPPDIRRMLEREGTDPTTWWVSVRPVTVVLDPIE